MSNKKSLTTLSIAAGTAFVASLATANVANAAEGANPFAMNELSSGYMQLAEAKCGGNKTMTKDMEGKCGGKKTVTKDMEGNCGSKKKMPVEGQCGNQKKMEKEGKCGEAKCGANKK